MNNLEKATLWFEENGYIVYTDDTSLYISVWNFQMENSIDVQVTTAEVDFRAELWQNKIKLVNQ